MPFNPWRGLLLVTALGLASPLLIAAEPNSIAGIGPVGPIEQLYDDLNFTEGPAADAEGNLYFSDIPDGKVYRIDAAGKRTIFLAESKRINGLMFNSVGQLIACQGGTGQLVLLTPPETSITVLADSVAGKRLGSPNDLVLDRTGGVYFTDPGRGEIYYRAADGKVVRFADGIKAPNGAVLSPDEQTLYVIPSGQSEMMAYDVTAPGKLERLRVFCTVAQVAGQRNTGGDGATVDAKGNLYIASRRGVQVFSPAGKPLGIIVSPDFAYPKHPANVTFGGKDLQTLFVTARKGVYRMPMQAVGHRFPGKSIPQPK